MRHYYIRLVFGIVWLLGAVVSVFTGALPFALMYAVLGAAFLLSAHSIKKKSSGK